MNIISYIFHKYYNRIYTFFVKQGFGFFGHGSIIDPYPDLLVGKRCITIGEKTSIGKHVQLTAWEIHNGIQYIPSINIGSGCQFGSYNHITAINSIIIGDGVLTGKFVTITDNSHGNPKEKKDLAISPIQRTVYSKGPVVIGNNVWIGDKVTILPNVNIGNGCIIGANAVVTKSAPPYSILVGNPAKIINIEYKENES